MILNIFIHQKYMCSKKLKSNQLYFESTYSLSIDTLYNTLKNRLLLGDRSKLQRFHN